jgi:thiamine pyrophosphate-dependent acetolactate synthase large subunit-like protein
METASEDGLTVIFNDETNTFTFEWDEETHPEYNFFKDFTDEDFATMIREYLATSESLDDTTQSAAS